MHIYCDLLPNMMQFQFTFFFIVVYAIGVLMSSGYFIWFLSAISWTRCISIFCLRSSHNVQKYAVFPQTVICKNDFFFVRSHVLFKSLQISTKFVGHTFLPHSLCFISCDIPVFHYFPCCLACEAICNEVKGCRFYFWFISVTTSYPTFYILVDFLFLFSSPVGFCRFGLWFLFALSSIIDVDVVFIVFWVYGCIRFYVVLFPFHLRTWCARFLDCASLIHTRTCFGGRIGFCFWQEVQPLHLGDLVLEDLG